jgi:threonine dehydratase
VAVGPKPRGCVAAVAGSNPVSLGTSPKPISLADIRAARERIAPYIRITPVVPFTANVFLKLESLQVTGSFKARGAFNHVLALAEQCAGGIVTASSGNHGQAVAFVAHTLGLPAVVVVPEDVVRTKADAITRYGAELIRHGRTSEQRITFALGLVRERGLHYVPPYDDPYVMAGQGTAGLEIAEQCDVDTVYVPVSGGGLISGVATAVRGVRPATKVIGVEPAAVRRFAESRAAGTPVVLPAAETIADGLRVLTPGKLTWGVTNAVVDEFVSVTDGEILDAVRRLAVDAHVVAEPSGAASVAAAARDSGAAPSAALVSGGNVDPALLVRAVAS